MAAEEVSRQEQGGRHAPDLVCSRLESGERMKAYRLIMYDLQGARAKHTRGGTQCEGGEITF